MKITCADGHAAGVCTSGQQRFFKAHGLDFRRFVREGFTLEDFNGIEDMNLIRTVEAARVREGKADA